MLDLPGLDSCRHELPRAAGALPASSRRRARPVPRVDRPVGERQHQPCPGSGRVVGGGGDDERPHRFPPDSCRFRGSRPSRRKKSIDRCTSATCAYAVSPSIGTKGLSQVVMPVSIACSGLQGRAGDGMILEGHLARKETGLAAPADVEHYLAALPGESRAALETLRKAIRRPHRWRRRPSATGCRRSSRTADRSWPTARSSTTAASFP